MSKAVHWLIKIEITEENLLSFKELMADMIASTQTEPGTLAYEWSFDDTGLLCCIYERYIDVVAAKIHLNNFGQFAERLTGACKSIDMTAMGNLDDEIKSMLVGLSPTLATHQAGFDHCVTNI
jgi:quinol monooxygenase YgiN